MGVSLRLPYLIFDRFLDWLLLLSLATSSKHRAARPSARGRPMVAGMLFPGCGHVPMFDDPTTADLLMARDPA